MIEPIMPGWRTNWRKNMPHWLKKDRAPDCPLVLLFFKGIEAINTRLFDPMVANRKSRARWQDGCNPIVMNAVAADGFPSAAVT